MSLTIGKLLAGVATVLVAVLAFLGTYNVNVAVNPVAPVLGAVSGPDVYTPLYLHQNLTVGGDVNASSTVATETLAASDISKYKLFNAKAAAAATVTLPTKSALAAVGFLPVAGDTAEWFIHASTSAITLAGGTGVLLRSNASSTIIYPLTTAKLTFTRLPAVEGSTYEVVISGMQ